MKKNYRTLLWIYAGVAILYYFQAQRGGLNPSITTAASWPFWLLNAPSGTISVLTGYKQQTGGQQ